MQDQRYRTPPERVDMAAAERAIRRSGAIALAVTLAAGALGWAVLPRIWGFPEALADRLAFAAQAALFVLVWVLAGMMWVSTVRRFSPADAGGAAARPPSPDLAIPAAFLQNTLEQAVMAAGLYLAFAAVLGGPWLSLLPVAAAQFALGRILFLRGYARGVEGRALGMQLTAQPTLIGYLMVIGIVLWRLPP